MTSIENLNAILKSINLKGTDFIIEKESQEYDAVQFRVNQKLIYFRKAKITPKKAGQFVTFWKRIPSGIIAPFDGTDDFQFLIVYVEFENKSGYFIFPKLILVQKNILSTSLKEGKRAFRIYASWDEPKNKQATTSQRWQLNYFIATSDLQNYLLKQNPF